MKADPAGVLTGTHFIDGDHAACEGALAAGCRFVAGYPITPSTEVIERFATRIPKIGGLLIQVGPWETVFWFMAALALLLAGALVMSCDKRIEIS